jgi:hypothetical protein
MNDVMVERLKRLLFLVSYVAKQGHKGMPVARAMKAAGYETERELNDAVRFVAMLGPPAGTPRSTSTWRSRATASTPGLRRG